MTCDDNCWAESTERTAWRNLDAAIRSDRRTKKASQEQPAASLLPPRVAPATASGPAAAPRERVPYLVAGIALWLSAAILVLLYLT